MIVVEPSAGTYRVEEVAERLGLSVDTVRYYQGLGLIDPPERRGRTAIYTDRHLAQLRSVRQLSDAGFTLAQIQRLVDDDAGALLGALAAEARSARRLTAPELAVEAGVPVAVVSMAVEAGVLEPTGDGFAEDAVPMLSAAGAILDAGVPLDRLAALAVDHDANVDAVVARGIDLVLDHVPDRDPDTLARLFPVLVDQATELVARHFRRAMIDQSLDRLRRRGDRELADALARILP